MPKKLLPVLLSICLLLSACQISSEDEISALQAQIEYLQSELDEMRNAEPTAPTEESPAPSEEPSPSPIPDPPLPSLSESDLGWLEFSASDAYWKLHVTAFRFVRASYDADMETARWLAADPDRDEWLQWFPTEKRSFDNLTYYFFLPGRYTKTDEFYEIDGEKYQIMASLISKTDAEYEMNIHIHFYTIYVNGEWKIVDHIGDP